MLNGAQTIDFSTKESSKINGQTHFGLSYFHFHTRQNSCSFVNPNVNQIEKSCWTLYDATVT